MIMKLPSNYKQKTDYEINLSLRGPKQISTLKKSNCTKGKELGKTKLSNKT